MLEGRLDNETGGGEAAAAADQLQERPTDPIPPLQQQQQQHAQPPHDSDAWSRNGGLQEASEWDPELGVYFSTRSTRDLCRYSVCVSF